MEQNNSDNNIQNVQETSQYQAQPQMGQPGPQVQPPMGAIPPQADPQVQPQNEKSKIAAGLFALFLGLLGIHKFYLGYTTEGIIMLVASVFGVLLCGLGPLVVGVIALIEGIIYLTKSDEDFTRTYVTGRRPWF